MAKIMVWAVTAAIPGDNEPFNPDLFTSEDAATARIDEMMREEWERAEPQDDDGEPLPYPEGDESEPAWLKACNFLADQDADGTWGRWDLFSQEVELPADPVRDAAPAMLAALRAAVARIDGVFDQSDLVAFGPLGDRNEDVRSILTAAIAATEGTPPQGNPTPDRANGADDVAKLREVVDALLPFAESRAEDLQEIAENEPSDDPEFDRQAADAAWSAVESARALLASTGGRANGAEG